VARTSIKANVNREGRSLVVTLLFGREVETIDLTRCRRAFARTAKSVFADRGVALETINFEAGQVLPLFHDMYPYNLHGRIDLLRGSMTAEQRDQFGEVFGQYLEETRHYKFEVQRRAVGAKRRSG
jgi:hypothetical protein